MTSSLAPIGALASALLVPPCLLAALAASAPGSPPGTPAFSDPLEIDNEFMPFQPGGMKVYVGRADGEPLVVLDLYLEETRTFLLDGERVECAVLQETEYEDNELVEISKNYFAQADDGAVYYFGEVVDDYEGGVVVDHGGSWLVGGPTKPSDPVDAATALAPAVFMPNDPEQGDTWKPEDLFPFVDETVELVAEDVDFKVPAGHYEDGIKVKETSALGPGFEHKWYAPGVGFAKSKSSDERLELVFSTLLPVDDDGEDG